MLAKVKSSIKSPFILFLLCNVIYSSTTFAFNIIFPLIFPKTFYDEFIYIFQMILFLVSLSGFGLMTALLAHYQTSPLQTFSNYFLSSGIVLLLILSIGFFPNNPISNWIHLDMDNRWTHLIFYISVILSSQFLFNRSVMNAEKQFQLMLKNILLITLLRLIGLFWIVYTNSTSILTVLTALFIIPFLLEPFLFLRRMIVSFQQAPPALDKSLVKFLSFSMQVFASGAIFILCDRIYLISLKESSTTLASTLSFAFGFIGIISVFNAAFTNYFLGKINPHSTSEIKSFQKKIRHYCTHYFILSITISLLICTFVYVTYDSEISTILIILILILKTAIISYFGFTNILTKTLKIQQFDLFINVLRLALVYIIINLLNSQNIVLTVFMISVIMIACELVIYWYVNHIVSKRILS